jgi:hypothetical protein
MGSDGEVSEDGNDDFVSDDGELDEDFESNTATHSDIESSYHPTSDSDED